MHSRRCSTTGRTHSPLDDAGLQKYMLARRGLNHLRSELPPQEA